MIGSSLLQRDGRPSRTCHCPDNLPNKLDTYTHTTNCQSQVSLMMAAAQVFLRRDTRGGPHSAHHMGHGGEAWHYCIFLADTNLPAHRSYLGHQSLQCLESCARAAAVIVEWRRGAHYKSPHGAGHLTPYLWRPPQSSRCITSYPPTHFSALPYNSRGTNKTASQHLSRPIQ